MGSMGMQLLGSVLALFGWIGVIIVCGAPLWRITAFNGNNTVTSQTIWEGIWLMCVFENTGYMQCMVYDTMLSMRSDLQAARTLVVASIVMGFIGLVMGFAGSKCTNVRLISEEAAKAKAMVAGVMLIISGILCIIPVLAWTGSIIITDFYILILMDAHRRELGAALYVGWGAAILLILGGGILWFSCPPNEDQEYSL